MNRTTNCGWARTPIPTPSTSVVTRVNQMGDPRAWHGGPACHSLERARIRHKVCHAVSVVAPAVNPPTSDQSKGEEDGHADQHDRALESIGIHDSNESAENHIDRVIRAKSINEVE